MKKTLFAAALMVAALNVSGCTGGLLAPQAATNAPTAGASTSPATDPAARQAWADSKMNQWLSSLGARNLDAIAGPFGIVTEYPSPAPGELVHVMSPQASWLYPTDIQHIGNSLLTGVSEYSQDLESVTVQVLHNGESATVESRTR